MPRSSVPSLDCSRDRDVQSSSLVLASVRSCCQERHSERYPNRTQPRATRREPSRIGRGSPLCPQVRYRCGSFPFPRCRGPGPSAIIRSEPGFALDPQRKVPGQATLDPEGRSPLVVRGRGACEIRARNRSNQTSLTLLDVTLFSSRPEGAPTYQPRATTWENHAKARTSPERAAQERLQRPCFALSGLGGFLWSS
jgi:hypothetical protein